MLSNDHIFQEIDTDIQLLKGGYPPSVKLPQGRSLISSGNVDPFDPPRVFSRRYMIF